MNIPELPIPAGYMLVTSGAYSEYGVHGVFLVKEAFCAGPYVQRYLRQNPDKANDYSFENYPFLAWLIRELGDKIEEVNVTELHLTDYGSVHEMRAWPEPPEVE